MQSLFQTNGIAWKLLRDTPDRYIYEAVSKGVDIPLPKEIEAGINDVSKRDGWNKAAATDYALPTETWREHVARRQRCLELRQKLTDGEISSINDMITYNLNIRQLAQDVIENCYDPEIVWAFYQSITKITVLDPTCGSGAFLFAALNILEPLYDACLDQMQIYLDEGLKPDNDNVAQILDKFSEILQQINHHPNRRYFILKTIIINNLYGVDIMQEATEICKLRLYLKLASQVDVDTSKENNGIEPLPDIDFNIRAGNTLVGFTSLDEVRKAVNEESSGQQKLVFNNSIISQIEQKAQHVDEIFQEFRNLQVAAKIDTNALYDKKSQLRTSLGELREELDNYLADEYEKGLSDKQDTFKKWKDSHEPFHWFVEFYGIMKRGGFDTIIGNPPYVEYSQVKKDYSIINYSTLSCGNLYAFTVERTVKILNINSRLGVIIPVASMCTDGYIPLQKEMSQTGNLVISSFNDRPGKLFDGLEHIRLSIILYQKLKINDQQRVFTTKYNKWQTIEREHLFPNLAYVNSSLYIQNNLIPKLSCQLESNILNKVLLQKKDIRFYEDKGTEYKIFYTRKLSYFVQILSFIPAIYDEKNLMRQPSELKEIVFVNSEFRDCFLALLNSNLFYWWLTIFSDCRNLNKREIYSIPFNFETAKKDTINRLSSLSKSLMTDIQKTSKLTEMRYKNLGKLKIQCIFPRFSKPIINEIDMILAKHYGFDADELDYIINYDIKYRLCSEDGD